MADPIVPTQSGNAYRVRINTVLYVRAASSSEAVRKALQGLLNNADGSDMLYGIKVSIDRRSSLEEVDEEIDTGIMAADR